MRTNHPFGDSMSTACLLLLGAFIGLLAGCSADAPPSPVDAGRVLLAARPEPVGAPAKPDLPGLVGPSDRFRLPLEDSPHSGTDQALVTAVLFGDLTDPETARVFSWLRKTSTDKPGDLRWVFKHYPSVRPGDTGEVAAGAAIWAARHGRFEAIVTALLAKPGPVDADRLAAVVRAAGLEPKGLDEALADPGTTQRVQADRRLAARLGVRRAPGLFLNGRRAGTEATDLGPALKRELTEARALVARGTPLEKVYDRLTQNGRRSAWMKIRAPSRPVRIGDRGKSADRGPDDRQTVMVPPGYGPGLGPAGAPVELVVFVELGCSLCARIIPVLENLHQAHPRDLHVSLRVLPDRRKRQALQDTAVVLLAMADHPEAFALVLAALKGAQDRQALAAAAERLGMDAKVLAAALKKPEGHLDRLEANRAAADRAGVRGSPYLFVSGRPIPGVTNIERLERMIVEELARPKGR